ncbi:MAG: hypothetical protein FWD17_13860 [Polyangiaceae bacterium]|nr:hypothetical protein [Polyangiaceae bacterium]
MGNARFSIRFERWYSLLSRVLFIPPEASFVDIEDGEVRARMAWAFAARFPRSSVASAEPIDGFTPNRGVHGWNGRWLVNGAGSGLVALDLVPSQRARVVGFPVQLRRLIVSVDDAAGLIAALQAGPS